MKSLSFYKKSSFGTRNNLLGATLMLSLLLTSFASFSQTRNHSTTPIYVMIDRLESWQTIPGFTVNRYTLNSKELYGVDETIEVYNVWGRGLFVFTVLPDFYSDSNWTRIDSAEVLARQLKTIDLKYLHRRPYFNTYPGQTKSLELKLVKEVDGEFYASNVCLTEIYLPMNYQSADTHVQLNSVQGVLNIRQPFLSIKQMMEEVWPNLEVFKGMPFVMDFRETERMLPNQHNFSREYLSKSFVLKGDTAYQFWIFAGWNTDQGYGYVDFTKDGRQAFYYPNPSSTPYLSFHRGSDRMLYIPGKGVVGGSYDFYFLQPYPVYYKELQRARTRTTKSKEELFQNVLEERIMIAEELK